MFWDKVVCVPLIPSQKNESCGNHWNARHDIQVIYECMYTFDHYCECVNILFKADAHHLGNITFIHSHHVVVADLT